MLVTLLGIVMLVSLSRIKKGPTKSLLPIFVTDFPSIFVGITSSPDASSAQLVIVTASPLISYFKLGLTDTGSAGLVSASGSAGLTSSLTSSTFSSTGLTSATGSTTSFSPHPPRSRGSVTMIRNKGTGFMGYSASASAPVSSSNSLRSSLISFSNFFQYFLAFFLINFFALVVPKLPF